MKLLSLFMLCLLAGDDSIKFNNFINNQSFNAFSLGWLLQKVWTVKIGKLLAELCLLAGDDSIKFNNFINNQSFNAFSLGMAAAKGMDSKNRKTPS